MMSGREEAAPAPTKARVLVVDDELALGRACARSLENGGHHVVVATDGVKAVELLEGDAFDVVVCDVWMPGMTGLDLLRTVRARDTGVQVVLLTGTPNAEDAERAAAWGALMYLVKPIELRVLLQLVDHAWRLRRRGVRLGPAAQELA
jgi:DNA-binding NtrC family response regulator